MRSIIGSVLTRYKFRIVALASGIFLVLGMSLAPVANAITIGGPSDCDDNAIIRCGVHSTQELMNKYNATPYVKAVYSSFGITVADINTLPSTDVSGRVTKDGAVFIDSQSQPVATNAVTGGRQDIAGSTRVNVNGAIFYKRPPSVSFQQNSLPAFVSMKNGRFQFAVIASCGNAVSATPTAQAPAPAKTVTPKTQTPAPKPAPKPAPAPVAPSQVQAQSQQQSVNISNTTPAAPAPAPVTPAATTTSTTTTQQPSTGQVSSLVNTGPASEAAIFLGSAGLGTLAYRWFLVKKILNSN